MNVDDQPHVEVVIIGSGFAGLAMARCQPPASSADPCYLSCPDSNASPGQPCTSLGCKRVVRSSTFYPTLSREHVELVTEEIREVRQRSVITADGTERQVGSS